MVEDLGVGRRVGARRPPDGALVYVYDLVHVLDAPDASVPPRTVLAAADGVGEGFVQDLVYQRALARPRDARDAREDPERELHVDALEVVLRSPEQPDRARRLPPLLGRLYAPPPGEEVARHGPLLSLDVLDAAGGDDLAPVHPGARTNVDNVVCGAYGLLVVLDHDERVPEVPQPLKRRQEPPVVPLVQPDGGLVEHVQNADEAASDLRGEPDPLRLPARERPRGTAQGEVPESHVDEEAEAFPDLLYHPLADDPLPRGELDVVEEALRVRDGELGELVDVLAADRDGEGLWPEPGALALRAGDVAHELLDLLPPVL